MVGFLRKLGLGSSSSSGSTFAMASSFTKNAGDDNEAAVGGDLKASRKPGGWKTMPFILGNETFERLASFSVLANFMVYLKREYHMDQVSASNLINIWLGVANFAPLLGAFLSDAYLGRFLVIVLASFAGFMGMAGLTLTAWVPSLRPKDCSTNGEYCSRPNTIQMGVLIGSLGLLAVATGGIRPCSIPFGVDQFDLTNEKGRRGMNSYYNWYYTSFTVVVMLALTVMVYVQDNLSWVIGFGIPTCLMLISIVLFFLGTRLYVYVKPEGSIFSGIAQVLVAAFRKRRLQLPHGEKVGVYYDPPLQGIALSKLPLTNEFRLLNKAVIVEEGEVNPDGSIRNKWRLSSIQQLEEVKCLIRVLPVWASGIICFTAATQQYTFTVSQALAMDRHVKRGSSFQIPAGSMAVVSMLAIGVWVPIYDRFLVPLLRRVTHHEGGITLLQRMGVGLVLSVIAMAVAGGVEKHRREYTVAHHMPLSVVWLAPQLILMGLAEAFNFIAQIEFYNKQFPENMRSIATSLFFCTIAGASYLSTFITDLVHNYTGGHGPADHDWLDNQLNLGRLDYFYHLLAVLGGLNFIYFILVSIRYRYKTVHFEEAINPAYSDLELSTVKLSN